ncbi:hypothetical protein [Neomoorella mulderi]|uniref:Uncharacterized protein n=1 Tax=Moorella mulderi DSM 14980 TaxID=1122241 RepID=A0A151ATG7_9FIRM|nr:hypothetical protein [Moorella mulderi]KYH30905.1 hypothetical protein MOMUL_27790 [Moorella mulderi DSM 14980]
MVVSYQQIVLNKAVAPEIVAAITAAIAVYMPAETGWQITTIRPLNRIANRWVLVGRQELMHSSLALERRRMAG